MLFLFASCWFLGVLFWVSVDFLHRCKIEYSTNFFVFNFKFNISILKSFKFNFPLLCLALFQFDGRTIGNIRNPDDNHCALARGTVLLLTDVQVVASNRALHMQIRPADSQGAVGVVFNW